MEMPQVTDSKGIRKKVRLEQTGLARGVHVALERRGVRAGMGGGSGVGKRFRFWCAGLKTDGRTLNQNATQKWGDVGLFDGGVGSRIGWGIT